MPTVGGRFEPTVGLLLANATLSSSPPAPEQTHDDIMTMIEYNSTRASMDPSKTCNVVKLLDEIHVATHAADTRTLGDVQRFWALPGVVRCLSVQYQLFRGAHETLASAQTAWLMMELRQAGHALVKAMEAVQRSQPARTGELDIDLYRVSN